MGADHSRPRTPAPPRVRRILVATMVPLFVVTVLAALALWPRHTPAAPDETGEVPRYHGTVTRVLTEACPPAAELPDDVPQGPCGTVTVKVEQGPDVGRQVETPIPAGPGAPTVKVDDRIVLVELTDPADPTTKSYQIAEHQRGSSLVWLAVLFAVAIVAFGRWRGLASLASLIASFAILLGFVLPGISAGQPPLLVAIVGSSLIMFVVLYLTNGITAQTSVAVLGTLGSLVLTGLLGALATAATHLTGFGSEDATTLSMFQHDVQVQGLLLAGIIIGTLGALDDVTITQAATVTELAQANRGLSRIQLYRAATRVGRAHIASTVNTIVLAYAGASLPLLLLLVADSRPVTELLTSEFMAEEIVRSVVGTLGLVAAVPLTNGLAALVATAGRGEPSPAVPQQTTSNSRPPVDRDAALAALSTPRARTPSTSPGWPEPEVDTDTAW